MRAAAALTLYAGLLQAGEPSSSLPSGFAAMLDTRNPPSYLSLDSAAQQRVDLGHAVFNTQWVAAGTPGASRRDGVGPYYNAHSCDECHNEGARGRGPSGDGPLPAALVMQLESPQRRPESRIEGDPIYGHVLNTQALAPLAPEGRVDLHFQPRSGRYPDGTAWTLRVPHYRLSHLQFGPLAPQTILKPRLAPALFGTGLLDAVAPDAVVGAAASATGTLPWQWNQQRRSLGRLGWQAAALSVSDQSAKAFAREMGLTSAQMPVDDCTPLEHDCVSAADGGTPEVSRELFDALVHFVRGLAVPEISHGVGTEPPDHTFVQLGCGGCHRPRLPIQLPATASMGTRPATDTVIAPYSDLRLHEMGVGLADFDASGQPVRSRWRTAPLWGLGYRMQMEHFPTFLHDGRARSVEEAILWHDGEARPARDAFERLTATQRQALLDWLTRL